jgi:hypothetical protein
VINERFPVPKFSTVECSLSIVVTNPSSVNQSKDLVSKFNTSINVSDYKYNPILVGTNVEASPKLVLSFDYGVQESD